MGILRGPRRGEFDLTRPVRQSKEHECESDESYEHNGYNPHDAQGPLPCQVFIRVPMM